MIELRGGVLGPVFAMEWITASRRWQGYALRSGFVACLLAALVSIWCNKPQYRYPATFQELAALGQSFYTAVIGTQLTLVMLAAPAATAGAICLDRSRGSLMHLLMTDLTDREIVLGKLSARLVPVVGLVGCALPVLALLALLGGVDPEAMIGAFLVTLGLAVLGCCLALVFSLWAGKTHEALLGTYAVWGVWMLANPMIQGLNRTFGIGLWSPCETAPPFYLAFASTWWAIPLGFWDYASFLLICLVISGALTLWAVLRLRPVCTREHVRQRRSAAERFGAVGRVFERATGGTRHLPGPSLDWNPVLWREWHRNRSSRGARVVVTVYVALALVFSLTACLAPGSTAIAAWVVGLQVAIGMLLLSVTAATALAEERVRGSLDILMSTPLSTREIVLGKWLGAFRIVPALAVLPTIILLLAAYIDKKFLAAFVTLCYILACGAAVTSVGLALATWIARLNRAVALTITLYVGVCVGWLFLIMLFDRGGPSGEGMMMFSPFFGPGEIAFLATTNMGSLNSRWSEHLGWGMFWAVVYSGIAAGFLGLTLATFNRCLGRVEDRARPPFPAPLVLTPVPARQAVDEELPVA